MSPQSFASKVRRRLVRIACRLVQWPRILFYRLLSSATIKGKLHLYQPLQSVGLGIIKFSGTVKIGFFPSPLFFSTYAYIEARNGNATISIGDGTSINNGFIAIAEHTSITIGQRVLIGTNVEIFDSDFHGLQLTDRMKSKAEWAKPVVIEDDVFLGSNVRVLKGVTIGRGSVIANSSVVLKDIPPNVVAGGMPAKVLRAIAA
jgi:acetyltransferase-like isoleucine patch superfamily enzyme